MPRAYSADATAANERALYSCVEVFTNPNSKSTALMRRLPFWCKQKRSFASSRYNYGQVYKLQEAVLSIVALVYILYDFLFLGTTNYNLICCEINAIVETDLFFWLSF